MRWQEKSGHFSKGGLSRPRPFSSTASSYSFQERRTATEDRTSVVLGCLPAGLSLCGYGTLVARTCEGGKSPLPLLLGASISSKKKASARGQEITFHFK